MSLTPEIMLRDQRTVKTISCQNCDKTTKLNLMKKFNKLTQHHRESRYTLHHLLIITVIVIMSSSYTNSLPVRQMVYDDPRCNAKYNRTKPHTKAELHNQIRALFDECNIVLNSTRSLAKDFMNTVWNDSSDSIETLHESMGGHNNPSFFPEKYQKGVDMSFRGRITETMEHRVGESESEYIERIYNFLLIIYERFDHMETVVMAIEDYTTKNIDRIVANHVDDKKKHVTEFFSKAKDHIGRVLCLIRGTIFTMIDMASEEVEKTSKLSKFKGIDGRQIRFDYWVMYREYETLVDYTYQMLNSILKG